MPRTGWTVVGGTLLAVAALVAAEPPGTRAPDDLLRAANAALLRGDADAAETLYAAAEERTHDPGLVAFNKAAVYARRDDFREAELQYTRALDDRDAPPGRRAKALYNRGVCLVRRGGLDEYRSAVDSFERCLALCPADDPTAADARHNLELAKLLWAQARAKERQKPTPNDPPRDRPPEPKEQPEPKRTDPLGADVGNDPLWQPSRIDPQAGGAPPNATPRATDQMAPGRGNIQVLPDEGDRTALTDEDAQEHLARLTRRLQKDRRDTAALTAPGERTKVKDW